MRAKFFCRTGELAGIDHPIDDAATIGRRDDNTLRLEAAVISQAHARIFFDVDRDRFILEDLQSKNGTRLDGRPVHGQEPLGDLHVVTLGEEHDFLFVRSGTVARGADSGAATVYDPSPVIRMPPLVDDPAAPSGGRPEGPETVYEPPAVLAAPTFEETSDGGPPPGDPVEPTVPGGLVVEVRDGASPPVRLTLGEGRHTIGRAPGCAVLLADRAVGREHAVLTVAGGRVTIEDRGSRNGTYIDGQAITGPVRLEPGMVATIGDGSTIRHADDTEGT